jgi:hypothetical protein
VPAPTAAAPVASATPDGAQPRAAIRILAGAKAGKEVELTKAVTTLGKPGLQVALLTRRQQGYFISHGEGARQPQVNGLSIGTAPRALNDHDIIELAGVKVEFLLLGSREAPTLKWLRVFGLALLVVVVVGFLAWRLHG